MKNIRECVPEIHHSQFKKEKKKKNYLSHRKVGHDSTSFFMELTRNYPNLFIIVLIHSIGNSKNTNPKQSELSRKWNNRKQKIKVQFKPIDPHKKGSNNSEIKHLIWEACKQWNWCTALDACCRIRWFGCGKWDKSYWPPGAPPTPVWHRCIQTWAASTSPSNVHHSTLVTCCSHGTQRGATYTKIVIIS